MAQLPLDLAQPPVLCHANFFVSDANREAHGWVMAWPAWPAPALLLTGPAASGKTHLARIWAAKSGARELGVETLERLPPADALADAPAAVIEQIERAPGEALFHLLNCAGEKAISLLLTTRRALPDLPFVLPDLRSRIAALPVARLTPPDDALLEAVLAKLFSDRQLRVTPDVTRYLLARMERSFAAAAGLVDTLDRAALERRRNLSLPFVRTLLEGQAA